MGTICLNLAISPIVLLILFATEKIWVFQDRFSSINSPRYLIKFLRSRVTVLLLSLSKILTWGSWLSFFGLDEKLHSLTF